MVRDRIRLLIVLVALPFLPVTIRLASLQLRSDSDQDVELNRAEERRRRISLLPATRGAILDRYGVALARDEVRFSLEFTLHELHPRERYLPVLERALGLCDDRCQAAEKPSPGEEAAGGCRGLVLEEQVQVVMGGAGLLDRSPEEAERIPDAIVVDQIPPLMRARVDQKLIGGVRSLEQAVGLYFIPSRDGQGFELRAIAREILSMELALKRLSGLTGRPYEELRSIVAQAQADVAAGRNATERGMARVQRRLLIEDVPESAVTSVIYQQELFPGIRVVDSHIRVYPRAESMGALTGQLRAPDKREVEQGLILDQYPLDEIDFILSKPFSILRKLGCCNEDGRMGSRGLEEYYDARLRGGYGVRVEEVDARHVPRKKLLYFPPERGEDLQLSLDADLQDAIYRALAELCLPRGEALAGSVAVMDLTGRAAPGGSGPPGALLAAVGFPGFDPNRMRNRAYMKELDDREEELHQGILRNRLTHVFSPPGSIFKLVVAVAALESGIEIDEHGGSRPSPLVPSTRFRCTHRFNPANSRSLKCLSQNGHGQPEGEVDLVQALQYSCNIYFYNLGSRRLDSTRLWAWSQEIGFGRISGIDLGSPSVDLEARAGLLKRDIRGSEGMCQYAIGQVHVEVSPLQVLRAVAAIALDGEVVPWPYLATPRPPEKLKMKRETARVIREGMYRVVHAHGGTAAAESLGLSRFRVAVKTGTAEFREGDPLDPDPAKRPLNYAWIAGYAPYDHPEVAFVTLLERAPIHGGDGAPLLMPLLESLARKEPAKYLKKPAAGEGASR